MNHDVATITRGVSCCISASEKEIWKGVQTKSIWRATSAGAWILSEC
jgi:hypothetical protein